MKALNSETPCFSDNPHFPSRYEFIEKENTYKCKFNPPQSKATAFQVNLVIDCLSQVTEQNSLRFNDIISYLKMYVDEEDFQMYIEIIKEMNFKLTQERIKQQNKEQRELEAEAKKAER